MKSFPSTLNRGGSNLQTNTKSSSIKDALKNAWSASVLAGKAALTTGIGFDTEGIRYSDERDKETLLSNMASCETPVNDGVIKFTHLAENIATKYEDPLNIPFDAINITNKYKGVVYGKGGKGIENANVPVKKTSSDDPEYAQTQVTGVTPSLFNPYYGMLQNGPTATTALLVNQVPHFGDTTDCSISNLVKLSKSSNDKTNPLGHARYKYSDFMYCKHLGKIPNNHLITLRKFAFPVGDNIFTEASLAGGNDDNSWALAGDVGRLVTWFGTEDNKLEDIMKYDFEATWKELTAKIEQKNSEELEGGSTGSLKGALTTTLPLINGNYAEAMRKGTNPAITLPFTNITIGAGPYQNNDVVLGRNYDENKVYEPQNTIKTTHIYEGTLKFSQEFNLVFSYQLRAYDNINPKSAFLDLLANVTMTTYKRGAFWGGRHQILGVQPNTKGWALANNLINKGGTMCQTFIDQLAQGNLGELFASVLGSLSDGLSSIMNKTIQTMAEGNWRKMAAGLANNAIDIGKTILKNHLGRPAVYQFNSYLNGGDVGLWHVTIGNPLNPIAAFGNLIVTKTSVQHLGPLGIDDFPTEMKVTVSLKHARPRDAFDIQKMYNRGMGGIYQPLTNVTNITDVYNLGALGYSAGSSKDKGPTKPENITKTGNAANNAPDMVNYLGDWDMARIQGNRLQLA